MWAKDTVRDGYDEIQHINMVPLKFYKDVTETRNMDRLLKPAERGADLDIDGQAFQDFLRLLKAHDTVVDPTVAIFFDLITQRPGPKSREEPRDSASRPGSSVSTRRQLPRQMLTRRICRVS